MDIGAAYLGNDRTPSSMYARTYATLNCSLHASDGWVTAGIIVYGRGSPASTNLGYAQEHSSLIAPQTAQAWCKHDGYNHRHETSCVSSRKWYT
jgi:hypothetical protein